MWFDDAFKVEDEKLKAEKEKICAEGTRIGHREISNSFVCATVDTYKMPDGRCIELCYCDGYLAEIMEA